MMVRSLPGGELGYNATQRFLYTNRRFRPPHLERMMQSTLNVIQSRFAWLLVTGLTISGLLSANGPVTSGRAAAEQPAVESDAVVFTDNFEDGAEKWRIIDPESWAIQQHGKGKSLSITRRESEYEPQVRSPRHIALVRDLQLGDFEITFNVKSTKDTGDHRDCCIFFNYQDPTHYYYVHLGARPDPASGQIFIVNDAPRTPLTDNTKRVPWSDDWHKVKLVRDTTSGKISVYFDDMQTAHLEVSDSTFGKGQVGLGSFDDMNAFDTVRITSEAAKQ